MRIAAQLLLALVLSSCATIPVDGYSLIEGTWRTDEWRAVPEIRALKS